MRYFLKLVDTGWFEDVDEYTFKHAKEALNNAGNGPRYTKDTVMTDGEHISISLDTVPLQDLAILTRFFQATEPSKVEGGFVREQGSIKFVGRNGSVKLRDTDGVIWSRAA
jgi:hypothetical protein